MARTEAQQATSMSLRIPVIPFGISLSLFCAITFALCVLFYVLFPESADKHVLLSFYTPWFKIMTWQGFLLGLAGSIVCGWYVALVFGPLYNIFAGKGR